MSDRERELVCVCACMYVCVKEREIDTKSEGSVNESSNCKEKRVEGGLFLAIWFPFLSIFIEYFRIKVLINWSTKKAFKFTCCPKTFCFENKWKTWLVENALVDLFTKKVWFFFRICRKPSQRGFQIYTN